MTPMFFVDTGSGRKDLLYGSWWLKFLIMINEKYLGIRPERVMETDLMLFIFHAIYIPYPISNFGSREIHLSKPFFFYRYCCLQELHSHRLPSYISFRKQIEGDERWQDASYKLPLTLVFISSKSGEKSEKEFVKSSEIYWDGVALRIMINE